MTVRAVVKTIVALVVGYVVLDMGLNAYVAYRYGNVSAIVVSKPSDLDAVFEVGLSSMSVRDAKFLKVCFAADYERALGTAKEWLAPNEAEFISPLNAAGGLADTFNDEGSSSIVLLSPMSAVILELKRRIGFSVAIVGCASTDNRIEIRKSRSDPGVEFWLPNATLRSTNGQ